ncbi:hypothetical protein ES703_78668 [subsurface metagenome]
MKRLEGFCEKSIQLGASKAKIIKAEEIAVADWVRLKCQYGCGGYGERLTCPPYSPTPSETRRIIAGYKRGILMKFRSCQECGDQGAVDIHKVVAEMERDLFLLGFYAAFGMACGPCNLCTECNLEECQKPDLARPSMEACGIDVYATARKAGFKIEVLTRKDQIPRCFGLILVE